jgi:hypothetical protein
VLGARSFIGYASCFQRVGGFADTTQTEAYKKRLFRSLSNPFGRVRWIPLNNSPHMTPAPKMAGLLQRLAKTTAGARLSEPRIISPLRN